MALDVNDFTVNGVANRVHSYSTGDSIADLTTAGYFAGIASSISIGDTIIVTKKFLADALSVTTVYSMERIVLTVQEGGTASVAGTYAPTPTIGVKASIVGDSNADNADYLLNGVLGRAAYGHFIWLQALSMGSIDIPPERNYALSGSTFGSNITNGRLALAANDESKLVVVALGINDINGGLSLATITANIDVYVETLRHKDILFLAIHPATGPSAAERVVGYQVNRYLRDLAINNSNIFFADATKYLVDPASATGAPKAGMNYDDVHIATTGAYYSGRAMKEALEGTYKFIDPLDYNPENLYNAVTNPTGNILVNSMFLGTGGSGAGVNNITGDEPDNWIIDKIGTVTSAACALSFVDKETAGRKLRMTLSGTAGSPNTQYRLRQTCNAVAGTNYQGVCGFEIQAGATNIESVTLMIFDSGTTTTTTYAFMAAVSGQNMPDVSDLIKGVMKTPVLPKAAGTATISFQMYVTLTNGAVCDAVVDFYNPSLVVVS